MHAQGRRLELNTALGAWRLYNAGLKFPPLTDFPEITRTDMGKKLTGLIATGVALHFFGSAIAEEHHGGHQHHHFPKDVDAFHSVLAPLWHARPGKERSRNACAKANEMDRLAKDIRSGDAAPLVASIAALKQTCQGNQSNMDAALSDVHDAFHRLAGSANTR